MRVRYAPKFRRERPNREQNPSPEPARAVPQLIRTKIPVSIPSAVPVRVSVPTITPRIEAPWSARAKALATEARASGKTLEAQITALLAAPEARGANISLAVENLAAIHADVALNPASNSKLATAMFALGVLGPSHTFDTPIRSDASGNLYLQGNFDFSLDPTELAVGLRDRGITEIRGDVILDNSALEGPRAPPGFENYGDQDWSYLARVEALSSNKNLVILTVRPGREGEPPTIIADQDAFEIRNKATTIAAKSQFKLACDEIDGQPIIEVWGEIAADFKKGKTLTMKSPDPVASFADKFRRALEDAGIDVEGTIRAGTTPASSTTLLHTHRSRPLGELLQESIATSNAFDHEMMALAAARAKTGAASISIERAMRELETFAKETLGLESIEMHNASGIGNLNVLSANDIVRLLSRAAEDPNYAPLAEALARPGRPGTLETRMLGTRAERTLRAKTGTGENAVALSGLIIDGDTRRAFSLLINDAPRGRTAARTIADAFGILVAESAESA